MMKQPFLSVVIPAYNEARRIAPTLLDIDSYLSKQDFTYEILVINDGSTDNTQEVLEKLANGPIRNFRVDGYSENIGKGGAVAFGMLEAKGEVRLFMDCDNSTPISEIEKLLPYLKKGFRVIIGSRALPTSKILNSQPFYKVLAGRIGNLITRILIVPKIKDTQCGFKLFTQKAVENIFPQLTINGAIFDVEILVLANFFGYRIKEVGIAWKNDLDSRFGLKSYLVSLFDTLKIRWNMWTKKYYKRLNNNI